MWTKIYLSLLVAIMIFSEAIMALQKANGPSNLLVRKRRIIDHSYQRRNVTLRDVPYIVNIRNKEMSQCGGSILSDNIILTGAQCVFGLTSRTINVMSNTIERTDGQHHMVKHLQMHPNYTHMGHMQDDLALLYIEPAIDLVKSGNRKIQFYNGPLHPGIIGTISGWGCTNIAKGLNAYPQTLQATQVPLISTEECHRIYEEVNTRAEKDLCTWHKEGKKGACRGDGGGPLVIDGKLAGVLSGYPVNREELPLKNKPDFYVNLAYPIHRDWIVETMLYLERIGPFAPWYGIPGFHESHHV